MVHVAKELERQDFSIPLLIGGATTSKVHTAVKIEQHYKKAPSMHVLDASKSVTVVGGLLGGGKEELVESVKEEYERIRVNHSKRRQQKQFLSLEAARKNHFPISWQQEDLVAPKKSGLQVFEDFDLAELRKYIDWTPFFQTWELHGRYPAILEDEVVGEEATRLFADAQSMMDKIVGEQWLTARGVCQVWPANADGDDIVLFTSDDRTGELETFHSLRQQAQKAKGASNMALADFVAPLSTGLKDFVGGFAVTAGIGIEERIKAFEADHDDYSSIMLKALADRLAEAFAEKMHELVRKDVWGYSADEAFDGEALIKEKYRGIRPAPGYPACPDHTEKRTLFALLQAEEKAGISLTESLAMYPTAAVSGLYFAHPEAKYFGLRSPRKNFGQ